jgi:hypothetical protein
MCIDYPEMNYYLANAEAEAQKFEPILDKTFMHMEMGFDFTLLPHQDYYFWTGKGTYGKKQFDYTRLTSDIGPCN